MTRRTSEGTRTGQQKARGDFRGPLLGVQVDVGLTCEGNAEAGERGLEGGEEPVLGEERGPEPRPAQEIAQVGNAGLRPRDLTFRQDSVQLRAPERIRLGEEIGHLAGERPEVYLKQLYAAGFVSVESQRPDLFVQAGNAVRTQGVALRDDGEETAMQLTAADAVGLCGEESEREPVWSGLPIPLEGRLRLGIGDLLRQGADGAVEVLECCEPGEEPVGFRCLLGEEVLDLGTVEEMGVRAVDG